jgi:hypothetical protein
MFGRGRSPLTAAAPFPFIVGAPRSGTSLLRLMLDSHSQLAIPPETGFVPHCADLRGRGRKLRSRFVELITNFPVDTPAWAEFGVSTADLEANLGSWNFRVADGLRAFYRLYAARFDKPRFGDKTPRHALRMPTIAQLLPEAHFIHIIRDGRDVAQSWRQMWFAPGTDVASVAREWRTWVEKTRSDAGRVGAYLEVRYERLVTEPQAVLRDIAAFIDLPFEEAMLAYYERSAERLEEHHARYRRDGSLVLSHEQRLAMMPNLTKPPDSGRIGAWRSTMTTDELVDFEREAGALLTGLGYSAA